MIQLLMIGLNLGHDKETSHAQSRNHRSSCDNSYQLGFDRLNLSQWVNPFDTRHKISLLLIF